jgi:predicted neuraminidase
MQMKHICRLGLFCLAGTFTANAQELKVKVVDSGYIFTRAPFKACHASTIVETDDHKLMAAWFGGDHEGSTDVCIWTSVKQSSGWTAPVKVADGIQRDGKLYACWNPVLFKPLNNKRLYLYYKIGPNPREWYGLYKSSSDNGKTWSAAIKFPHKLLGPIKNKPIQLANGNILYPSSIESTDEKTWTVHLEQSSSSLHHWRLIKVNCDTFGVIQPTLLTYKSRLQMLARSKQNVIVQSWSTDNGQSWSPLTPTSLPNPNSGIDGVTTSGHLQLLVYNPLPSGKNWWEGRAVLKLAASTDGVTWRDIYTFENHNKGEYSYPAIISDSDGFIDVTYTSNRKYIEFYRLIVQ